MLIKSILFKWISNAFYWNETEVLSNHLLFWIDNFLYLFVPNDRVKKITSVCYVNPFVIDDERFTRYFLTSLDWIEIETSTQTHNSVLFFFVNTYFITLSLNAESTGNLLCVLHAAAIVRRLVLGRWHIIVNYTLFPTHHWFCKFCSKWPEIRLGRVHFTDETR